MSDYSSTLDLLPALKQRQRRFVHRMIVWGYLVYFCVIICLWFCLTRYAGIKTEELLEYAIDDFDQTMVSSGQAQLLSILKVFTRQNLTGDACGEEALERFKDAMDVHEITVIGKDGQIVSTTRASWRGKGVSELPELAPYLALLDGGENSRISGHVERHDGRNILYAGLPLASRDCVLRMGVDVEVLARNFYSYYTHLVRGWRVGNEGFLVLCDRRLGEVVCSATSGLSKEMLSQIGRDMMRDELPKEIFVRKVEGNEYFCRLHDEHGFRVMAIVPDDEYYDSKNLYMLVSMVSALLITVAIMRLVRGLSNANAFSRQYLLEAQKHMEEDLNNARTIQCGTLPDEFPPYPDILEFDIFATMKPAKEVGGDFYDFFHIDPSHLAFLIADVSGKGISAAMFMMSAKTTIRSIGGRLSDPADILAQANRKLSEGNDAEMFVTVWLGVLNKSNGEVMYANGGHNPPYLKHGDGRVERLEGRRSLALGVMADAPYVVNKLQLEPGDTIILYTDGVTEAVNEGNELFGDARLREVIACTADGCYCKGINSAVAQFAGSAEQADDITLLELNYRGKPLTFSKSIKAELGNMQEIVDFLDEKLAETRCPSAMAAQMQIAADEIVSNIIRYSGTDELSVTMEHEPKLKIWKLEFRDQGKAWNPLTHIDPDITLNVAERPIGGLGLLMVKKIMDNVKYVRDKDTNVLSMRKSIARKSSKAPGRKS